MAQMKREQKQAEDVKAGHIIILKSVHHHGVNVVVTERISLKQAKPVISNSHREVREMINNKSQHDQSAHHHMTRGKGCFDVPLIDIRLRTGTPVFNCQLDSHVDVSNDRDEQKNPNQPKQRTEVAQMFRVTIDPIRSDKYLQIPEQMSDHKQDQNDAGDRDDYFFSDRRTIKMCQKLHATNILQERRTRLPSARRSDAEAAQRVARSNRLAAEFQIMDAGCSVKL